MKFGWLGNPKTVSKPEVAWLLDDGQLCLGVKKRSFVWVTYTDPDALRFAREEDAEQLKKALAYLSSTSNLHSAAFELHLLAAKPVDHQWG